MLDLAVINDFLAQHRLAIVGISTKPSHIGNVLFKELTSRGYDVVPISTTAADIDGTPCYHDLASVPAPVDGAILCVSPDTAAAVVDEVADAGVSRVWLFQGYGKGAATPESVAAAKARNMQVVEGACPLMFVEPVGWFHKLHRGMRHLNHSLPRAA